ncbi:hypothetical protein MHBO_003585, partial [Bonamia ostreae]
MDKKLPKKYNILGDCLILPKNSNFNPEKILEKTKIKKIAIKQNIANNIRRSSQTKLIFGDSSEVVHKENGIFYNFDIEKTMFCTGNLTEKIRVTKLCHPFEVVADLYAGIGYFTLPFLVKSKVAKVFAFEINPRNLELNKIEKNRCVIVEGDNRITVKKTFYGIADRVNLGLLPSSKDGWISAINLIKEEGGTLHIHENVLISEKM